MVGTTVTSRPARPASAGAHQADPGRTGAEDPAPAPPAHHGDVRCRHSGGEPARCHLPLADVVITQRGLG